MLREVRARIGSLRRSQATRYGHIIYCRLYHAHHSVLHDATCIPSLGLSEAVALINDQQSFYWSLMCALFPPPVYLVFTPCCAFLRRTQALISRLLRVQVTQEARQSLDYGLLATLSSPSPSVSRVDCPLASSLPTVYALSTVHLWMLDPLLWAWLPSAACCLDS